MLLFKKLVLSLCVISLTACAGVQVPNGKLNPQYKELVGTPIDVAITEPVLEEPLGVKVPVTNISAGGPWFVALAAVAVSAAATGVSHAKRADEKAAILDSINDNSMYEWPGKAYTNTIKKAEWLDIAEFNKISDVDLKSYNVLKNVDKETLLKMEGKAFGAHLSSFMIGEQFESLTQHFMFQIYNVKNGKADKELYKLYLSDVYYPENSMDEGFENHTLWIENNNAEIKKAIKETTKNINEQLKEHLADPYYEPEEQKQGS